MSWALTPFPYNLRLPSSFWAEADRAIKALTATNNRILFIKVLLSALCQVSYPRKAIGWGYQHCNIYFSIPSVSVSPVTSLSDLSGTGLYTKGQSP